MGADTKANFGGGGALQVGDLRLLEDGGERGGALLSDLIPSKAASEGRNGNGGRASMSTGADTKANKPGERGPRVVCERLEVPDGQVEEQESAQVRDVDEREGRGVDTLLADWESSVRARLASASKPLYLGRISAVSPRIRPALPQRMSAI